MTPAGEAAPSHDPRASKGDRRYRHAALALFCAGFATFSQVYSLQGLLPEIAGEFGVATGTSSWAIGATTVGLALGMIPWARLSDRIGRVPVMRWALLGSVLIGLATPLMPNFELFIAARLLAGIALAGVPAVAVTTIAETLRPGAMGAAIGTYVAGNTLGGLAGRILSAETGELWGWRVGVLAVAGIAAAAALVSLLFVPPTAVPAPAMPPVWRGLYANLRSPGVAVLVAQAFLLTGAFVSIYNYLSFRLQLPPFEFTLAQSSWLFLAYLLGAAVSRGIWRFVGSTPPTTVILYSAGLMLAGLALTLFGSLIAVIAGLLVFTGGFFGTHVMASSLISQRAGESRSLAVPLYNIGFYAGSSLLGWLGGVAFSAAAWPGTAALSAGATVLAAALVWLHARSERSGRALGIP